MAVCEQCGEWFARRPSETWKTLCVPCWKEQKRGEVDSLREENEWLRRRLNRLEGLAESPAWLDFLRAFPLLVRLCHPDRNGGSREANDATRYLLALREQVKKLPGCVADAHRAD